MIIEIYTKENCIYCSKAKEFLAEKGLVYSEYILGKDYTKEFIVENFPSARTYPVIIIDGVNIGGYDSLKSHYETIQNTSTNSLRYLSD
jgi:glutaredoxin